MVPKLRFREFNEQWDLTLLGDVTSKIGSGSTPKGGSEVYQSTGTPFIRSQNVNDNQLKLNDLTYIPHEIDEKMKGSRVQPNDILLNITGASIGRSCVVPQDFPKGNVNQHVCIIRLSRGVPKFYQAYLSSQKGQNLINSSQGGSGREGLNFENIRNFKIYSCSKAEQTKIADFLSSVDEKIALLNKQYDLLCQYKKGMMQKIFSQELRFRDENGEEFPEWNFIIAGEIFKNSSNKNHKGDLPILAVTQEKGVVNRDSINIDIKSSQESINSYKIIDKGDFVISLRSFQGGIEYSPLHGICSPAYTVLKNIKPIIDSFYRFYLKKDSFIEELSQTVVGIRDGKQISYKAFSILELPYPSLPEQKKIADFLSAIDEKITTKKAELDTLKTWKQGLLQQMFV